MPLQNRVDPWGQLNAVSSRGALLGNRGILHNEEKQIIAQSRHKTWITCHTQFKDRKRSVFAPNTYSELFFVDEATAFAAGHRPCGECRRDRYKEFKTAWIQANRELPIGDIDKTLHGERIVDNKHKRTYEAQFDTLPQGTFVELEGKAFLLWQGKLLKWSFDGYSHNNLSLSPSQSLVVLTPKSIVNMFASGFVPQVHESADY